MTSLAGGYRHELRGHLDASGRRIVTKRYRGPDAADRRRREALWLDRLQGLLPVPQLRPGSASGFEELTLGWIDGVAGQVLLDAGFGTAVLRACGEVLRRLHALDLPAAAADTRRAGSVVHGDFGPHNVLLDAAASRALAVVDWEDAPTSAIRSRTSPGASSSSGCTIRRLGQSSMPSSRRTATARPGSAAVPPSRPRAVVTATSPERGDAPTWWRCGRAVTTRWTPGANRPPRAGGEAHRAGGGGGI